MLSIPGLTRHPLPLGKVGWGQTKRPRSGLIFSLDTGRFERRARRVSTSSISGVVRRSTAYIHVSVSQHFHFL